MVRRAIQFLNREIAGLHQAALLLGVSALVSQLLGLFRDRLLAGRFGAGEELDIYYAAFRLPDLVYAGMAGLVSVSVLIPILVRKFNQENNEAARRFLDGLLTVFLVAAAGGAALFFFLVPFLAGWLAPGFNPFARQQLIDLTRILLLSPIFLGLSNIFGVITQSFRRFFIYALSPILYNLGIIFGVAILAPSWELRGLAAGVVLGAFLHLAIQVPFVYRAGLFPRLATSINWREVWEVVSLSLPRTVTLGAIQLTTLVLLALASLLSTGSIAIFNLAMNLQSVPLVIIGVSYSVAAFPTLSRLAANGQRSEFLSQITTALRHILFWSLPLVGLFVVLRAQIVRVILGTGRFDWGDTRLTAAALALFVVSMAAQSLVLLFVRGYYASGQTRRPLFINVFSAGVTVVLAVGLLALFERSLIWRHWFEGFLRVEGLSGTEVLMLPLALSLGALFNCFLLWRSFQRHFGRFSAVVNRALAQAAGGALAGGVVSYYLLQLLDDFFDLNTFIGVFSQGFLAGLGGLAAFAVFLWFLGNNELAEVVRSAKSRFWRAKTVAPEPEGL